MNWGLTATQRARRRERERQDAAGSTGESETTKPPMGPRAHASPHARSAAVESRSSGGPPDPSGRLDSQTREQVAQRRDFEARRGEFIVMTLNNESAELNRFRIERFGLSGMFSAFLSSCWLHARKPTRAFFERAFGVANANPQQALLVDDREQNIVRARELGMQTIHCTNPKELHAQLVSAGLLRTGS